MGFISSSSKNSLFNGMKILWYLKSLWEMGSRRDKLLWDSVSQCEVWHVCLPLEIICKNVKIFWEKIEKMSSAIRLWPEWPHIFLRRSLINNLITLKEPNCRRWLIFFFLYYFSEKIRFDIFIFICLADNSHEMLNFIFPENNIKKKFFIIF